MRGWRPRAASTWFAAGNTIYVGNNHAESQGTGISITTLGNSAGAIAKVLCHTASGPYPPTTTATGATVSTTVASGTSITLTLGGSLYCEGVAFKAGSTTAGTANFNVTSSGAAANQAWSYYKNCSFQLTSTAANGYMNFGPNTAYNVVTFDNCTVKFGAVTQYVYFVYGQFLWKNTGAILEAGSAIPTSLIYFISYLTHDIVLEALDLSQLTGNIISFPALTTGAPMGSCLIKDCKLNATGTVATPTTTGYTIQLMRSSS